MSLLLNVDVPQLAEAERFYSAAFGLSIQRRWSVGVVEMAGWPVRLFLLRKDEGSAGASGCTRSYARHWTPVHFDVVVPDVAAAFRVAVASGAGVDQPPSETSYGAIAMLADPFGNGFCLLEFDQRGYEALADVAASSLDGSAGGGR